MGLLNETENLQPVTQTPTSTNQTYPTVLEQNRPGTVINQVTGEQPNQSLYNFTDQPGKTPDSMMMTPPNLRTIDPEKETVQGQLQQIMKSDSPLMRLAERQGLEQAQRRGLLNTSLAAESAQVGMMREARPIAEHDAAAYMRQGLANQEVENKFLGAVQQAGLQNWLAAAGDTRKQEMLKQEFEQQRQLLSDEYGFKMEETAGKQNAALWAQFIQGAAEINNSDMAFSDKSKKVAELKKMTLDGMATNALQFKDIEMYDWLIGQMNNVKVAVNTATASGGTTNPFTSNNTSPVTYDDDLNVGGGG